MDDVPLLQASQLGPAENFSGQVWIDEFASPGPPSRLRLQMVRFAPGSRTAWHTHPCGQTLLITDGSGLVQRRGGSIEPVHAGDVVVFQPGEWHWHGAGPKAFMAHLAVQEADENGLTAERGLHVAGPEYPAS